MQWFVGLRVDGAFRVGRGLRASGCGRGADGFRVGVGGVLFGLCRRGLSCVGRLLRLPGFGDVLQTEIVHVHVDRLIVCETCAQQGRAAGGDQIATGVRPPVARGGAYLGFRVGVGPVFSVCGVLQAQATGGRRAHVDEFVPDAQPVAAVGDRAHSLGADELLGAQSTVEVGSARPGVRELRGFDKRRPGHVRRPIVRAVLETAVGLQVGGLLHEDVRRGLRTGRRLLGTSRGRIGLCGHAGRVARGCLRVRRVGLGCLGGLFGGVGRGGGVRRCGDRVTRRGLGRLRRLVRARCLHWGPRELPVGIVDTARRV